MTGLIELVESPKRRRRRRKVVAGTAVVGASVLGSSLRTEANSPRFYGLTLAVAAIWTVGGRASGKVRRGRQGAEPGPVVGPVLLGVGAFAVFYAGALVVRQIPMLKGPITRLLGYAHEGSSGLVLFTTLANGAAEEVFFRGAVYAAAGDLHPIVTSTALYSLTTVATRNPALVFASLLMGTLFGFQRRSTGGIQAPMITHLTWSALMLKFLPPLFKK